MIDRPKEFFDGTEMPTPGWWEALWPDPARVVCAAGVEPGMEVIDLCSGDGWFTLHIARIARHVVAIDIDPSLLDVARLRLAEGGAGNCTYIAGDAYRLAELWKKPVDLVFMANAFHGVPNKERLACRVRDVLKPDGKFAVVNWHQRAREDTPVLGEPRGPRTELRIGPLGLKAAVEPSGLTLTEAFDIPPYHYGAVFEK